MLLEAFKFDLPTFQFHKTLFSCLMLQKKYNSSTYISSYKYLHLYLQQSMKK